MPVTGEAHGVLPEVRRMARLRHQMKLQAYTSQYPVSRGGVRKGMPVGRAAPVAGEAHEVLPEARRHLVIAPHRTNAPDPTPKTLTLKP